MFYELIDWKRFLVLESDDLLGELIFDIEVFRFLIRVGRQEFGVAEAVSNCDIRDTVLPSRADHVDCLKVRFLILGVNAAIICRRRRS